MDIKLNNFDLIRLFAAIEVIYGHCIKLLTINFPLDKLIGPLFSAFPGVPIFFMISGFLITASFEKNPDIKQYMINRALRIYPALWVCFIFSVVMIASFGFIHNNNILDFIIWSFCQLTFFQIYNPTFLRGFGIGVVNGSLWTITVELQFYIFIPILYAFIKRYYGMNHRTKFFWILYLALFIITPFLWGQMLDQIHGHSIDYKQISTGQILLRIMKYSLLPNLYCFLIGILMRLHFDTLKRCLVGRIQFLSCLFIYLSIYAIFRNQYDFYLNHPITMMLLAPVVFSFAFNFPTLSNRLLKNNDFSYGIYLYHAIIINLFIELGLVGDWYYLPCIFIISGTLAYLSWKFIEKPILTLKRNPLRATSMR